MADCTAKLKSDIAAAQDAYHKLVTGQSVRVFVDQNGERVEYAAANARTLLNYISTLQQQLANGDCGGIGISTVTRPVGFLF